MAVKIKAFQYAAGSCFSGQAHPVPGRARVLPRRPEAAAPVRSIAVRPRRANALPRGSLKYP